MNLSSLTDWVPSIMKFQISDIGAMKFSNRVRSVSFYPLDSEAITVNIVRKFILTSRYTCILVDLYLNFSKFLNAY